MAESSDVKWSLPSALWRAVGDLFPSSKAKAALWALVGLGVAITFMELLAAQIFSSMITTIGSETTSRSAFLLVVFVATFSAVKGVQYFQSVYRLTAFERSFRSVPMPTGASEAWRWPMALELVGVLGVLARLGVVVITVANTQWGFGLVLLLCSVIAVLIVTRTGRRQYEIHHGFVDAKRAGKPPTPAERVRTRIRAGERAGLVATVPIVVFIAALGAGALDGAIAPEDALLLFIAARMAANLYGTLAASTMRFVRSEVNVEAFSGGSLRTKSSEARGPATDPPEPLASGEPLVEELLDRRALWEPPIQSVARLMDDGSYLGEPELIGRIGRDLGFGQDTSFPDLTTSGGATELHASEPNQIWIVRSAGAPVVGASGRSVVDVIIDAYSRAALSWRVRDATDDDLEPFAAAVCRAQGVESTDVSIVSTRLVGGPAPTLHDLIASLGGVIRVLQWRAGDDYAGLDAPKPPDFPVEFPSVTAFEQWADEFFPWYNDVFYQPDIGYLHPSDVHAGHGVAVATARTAAMEALEPEFGVPASRLSRSWGTPEHACVEVGNVRTSRTSIAESSTRLDDDDDDES